MFKRSHLAQRERTERRAGSGNSDSLQSKRITKDGTIMPNNYDVGLHGRAWEPPEAFVRHRELPQKVEMVRGKLFWSDEDRLLVLAALLEQMGAETAVRIGEPEIWRSAIRGLT